MNISEYRAVIFDCDGVVLNSNKVKSMAFYNAALPYGAEAAEKFVKYHVANGGVSRYVKFEYFLNTIVDCKKPGPSLEDLLNIYASEVKKGLMQCEVATGLGELRKINSDAQWSIVSGGDQTELREIFEIRGLHDYFDAGIFGSPRTKEEIIADEFDLESLRGSVLFVGDNKLDYEVAHQAGIDFIFISDWTEMPNWKSYCKSKNLQWLPQLKDLKNLDIG